MIIKHISCYFNTEERCHDLIITTDKDKYFYSLESAMVYNFGIIHSIRALINLISGTADIFCYGKALHAANQEIKLLETVITHLINRRDI